MNHRSEDPGRGGLAAAGRPAAPVLRIVTGGPGESGFAAAVERLRAAQRAPDRRTAGVLLWYSLSGALATDIVLRGRAFPAGQSTVLRAVQGVHGFIEEVDGFTEEAAGPGDAGSGARAGPPASLQAPLPALLGAVLRDLIPRIAAASGARERVLWAIATDAVAAAAVRAAPRALPAGVAGTVDLLLRDCRPEAPDARFETVAGRGTVVLRGSCCLLYRCPAGSMCLSCPRQLPADRRRRLTGGP